MSQSVAFFGAGPIAQPYFDALRTVQDVQITAACDLEPASAARMAAGCGAKVYARYEQMLEQSQPDALWLCLPANLQSDAVLQAIERRIPFFVSPPGAADYQQAKQCADIIQKSRLVTAVGFPHRDADVVQEAREYLGTNIVPLALGWWLSPPCDSTIGPSVVRQLWAEAVGTIDAMRYFCGELTRVRALVPGSSAQNRGAPTIGASMGGVPSTDRPAKEGAVPFAPHEQPRKVPHLPKNRQSTIEEAQNPGQGRDVECMVLQLEFARGTMGVLTCATFRRPEPRIELELMGENWSLRFGRDLASLRLDEQDKSTILRGLTAPAMRQTAAFLEAVKLRDPALVSVPYEEAMRTMAVCHAAVISLQERREVSLSELE